MLAWLFVWSEVRTCIWPSWCHCRSLSLASVKSRLVLPFWYRLTRVVPEKGPLNGCVCCSGPMVPTKNPEHSLAQLCQKCRHPSHYQPATISSIIKSRRLTLFGHPAWMDENADDSQAIFKPPPENWRRPPGWPHTTWMKNIRDDLSSLDLGIYEARDLVQNRLLWRLMSLHNATHS